VLCDATSRAEAATDKGAINNQSLVVQFDFRAQKILMTGDMQFTDPQVSDESVVQAIEHLKASVAQLQPFALVKLAHHGSNNGFSEEFWTSLGKPRFVGICTGSKSANHPNPRTLDVLKTHTTEVTWARTDHNGRTSWTFVGGTGRFWPSSGQVNDSVPNSPNTP
jgi:beta-lactamase superfamily II metal-dependent hydrolase